MKYKTDTSCCIIGHHDFFQNHADYARSFATLLLITLGMLITTVSYAIELSPIPANAELIFSKKTLGQRTLEGFLVNELYVADSNGDHVTQITRGHHLYNHFAVSPNRQRIAAIRFAGDTNNDGRVDASDWKTLWVQDLALGIEWPLLRDFNAGWGGVDWSPGGQYIYLSVLVNGQSDIYRIRPNGSGLKNITKNLNALLGIPKWGKWVSDVSVSFDGQLIAFLYSNSADDPNRIAVARVDGSAAWLVTDGGGPDSPHAGGVWGPGDYDPEFSPDGRSLCFQRATDAALSPGNVSSHDIMTINLDRNELARLSPEDNQAVHGICDWSIDNRIVFSEWSSADGYVGPVIVHADGSNYHRLPSLWRGEWVRWIPQLR